VPEGTPKTRITHLQIIDITSIPVSAIKDDALTAPTRLRKVGNHRGSKLEYRTLAFFFVGGGSSAR